MSKGKKIWESLGATEPYYAVYSVEKFLNANLDGSAIDEFFTSGSLHTEKLWADLKEIFGFEPRPERALDFGCGVGRILLALAERSQTAVGVDVSESMLAEARLKVTESGRSNIELYQTSDFLSRSWEFDFIHSFIVFQHIEPNEGLNLMKGLIEMLSEGGVGMIHLVYHNYSSTKQKIKSRIYRSLGPLRPLLGRLRGRKSLPQAPMNAYDLSTVLSLFQKAGCHKVSVRFTDHGLFGVMIFFQKGGSMNY